MASHGITMDPAGWRRPLAQVDLDLADLAAALAIGAVLGAVAGALEWVTR